MIPASTRNVMILAVHSMQEAMTQWHAISINANASWKCFPMTHVTRLTKKKKLLIKALEGTQTARKIERANIPYRAALVL
jgi:hypothetical protein